VHEHNVLMLHKGFSFVNAQDGFVDPQLLFIKRQHILLLSIYANSQNI
jgi:hypothetical protein